MNRIRLFTIDGLLALTLFLVFQTSKTGSPTEYGQIEETISPVALKTISDWILKHTTGNKKPAPHN